MGHNKWPGFARYYRAYGHIFNEKIKFNVGINAYSLRIERCCHVKAHFI